MGMTYTIMDIPYWSIIPNLTSDPEEREKYLFYQEFLPASVSLLSSPASVFRLSRTWRQLYWLPQICINYRSNLYFYNGCLRYQPAKETAGYRNCRK